VETKRARHSAEVVYEMFLYNRTAATPTVRLETRVHCYEERYLSITITMLASDTNFGTYSMMDEGHRQPHAVVAIVSDVVRRAGFRRFSFYWKSTLLASP
jgi:hypothetical protein